MKILYYTATGNSLYVAKKFDAELLSIPKLIKDKKYLIEDDVVGIVYPVHSYSVPRIMKNYIKNLTIKANYIFVIATYGNQDAAAINCMRKVLKKRGIIPNYMNSLLMVDTYLPLFNIEKEMNSLKDKKIDNNLNKIVDDVLSKKNYIRKRSIGWIAFSNFMDCIGSKFVRMLPRISFKVDDNCICCGTCSRVCPTKNIIQKKDNKPTFGKNCESCFACLHNCPKKAIHIGMEKSKERFRNENINLNEIIDSNNQTNK